MSSSYAAWRARLALSNDPKFWPIEVIDRLLNEGSVQFWACDAAAMLTRVVSYPGGAVAVEALAGAGSIASLAALTPDINRWASGQGATHLLIHGRPGWSRALAGWQLWQSILIKEVAHE